MAAKMTLKEAYEIKGFIILLGPRERGTAHLTGGHVGGAPREQAPPNTAEDPWASAITGG